MRPLPIVLCATVAAALLTGCTSPTGGSAAAASRAALAAAAPIPGLSLPQSPLLGLVPSPAEAPRGMVPLLTSSGPRTLTQVASFSADTATAARTLTGHGFVGAYVVQYANPQDGRVLAVVASRFTDPAGAAADLASDETAQSGTPLVIAAVGESTQARRGVLPGKAGGELLYLRFRSGATTWLVAYGARPSADPAVATALARVLVARSSTV